MDYHVIRASPGNNLSKLRKERLACKKKLEGIFPKPDPNLFDISKLEFEFLKLFYSSRGGRAQRFRFENNFTNFCPALIILCGKGYKINERINRRDICPNIPDQCKFCKLIQ